MNLDTSGAAITGQLQPGSDVRASYQLIDGKAKALKIEVQQSQPQNPPDQQEKLEPPPPAQDTPNPMGGR